MIRVPVTEFNIEQARRVKEINQKPPAYRREHEVNDMQAFANTMADLIIAASKYERVG